MRKRPLDALAYRPAHAAPIVGVSPRTLHAWRMTGEGPPFIKKGRTILYPRAALERWLESELNGMEADADGSA